jgi:uncharacterized protein (TIGR03083 family)
MTTTIIDVAHIRPLSRPEAVTLAATEFDRLLDLLRSLDAGDWARPTDCELWDVRAMVAHVVGAAEAQASVREFAHQMRVAKNRTDGLMIDAMTATQVRERAGLSPAQLVARLSAIAAKAVRARRRLPRPLRGVRIKVDPPYDRERWTLGYLNDVIFNRDAWMHRIDITQATGRPMMLTPEHDGRIVADVVAEWARRHGRPFEIVLDGDAGGAFRQGDDGESLRLDAVQYCRILSGRAEGAGLLSTEVPF